MQIPRFAKTFEKFLSDNSPSILTAIGVTGTIATAYLTGKAAYASAKIIENAEYNNIDPVYPLSSRGKVELTWRYYIPAITTGVITCGCIIMANRIGSKRAAALAAAYSLSDKAFDEYREKVRERLGDKEEQKYRDEIAQDRVRNNPPPDGFESAEPGAVLFCEAYTGRYLYSTMETLKKAQNDTNYSILHDGYASLSDFYNNAGMPVTSISDELGWRSDKMMELYFSTTEHDGDACMVFTYQVEPIRNFYKVH